MNTSTQLDVPPQSAATDSVAARRRDAASPEGPTWGEAFSETTALVDAPAFFGPPISFVLGPWLLLVLLLIGPLALLFTLVLVLAGAAVALAVLVGVIASPHLLIRHLHAHAMVQAKPRALVHPFRNHRVGSGRPVSSQPKGIS